MEIKVKYFGMLSELVGKEQEVLEMESGSDTSALKEKLFKKYDSLSTYDYKLALNLDLIQGEASLKDNDEVAFLPPYAGG